MSFEGFATLVLIVSKNRSDNRQVTYDKNKEKIAFIWGQNGIFRFNPIQDMRDTHNHQIERAYHHEYIWKCAP